MLEDVANGYVTPAAAVRDYGLTAKEIETGLVGRENVPAAPGKVS